ncbi:glycosyltransferase [Sphingomonas faeni]|uniref:glycosyltransferase n=1 Tax=Sphingomonas faeni TaxID=185950 RepID=UPI003356705B
MKNWRRRGTVSEAMPAIPEIAEPAAVTASADALLSAADAARDKSDWAEALRAYRGFLAQRPDAAGIWVQFGHAAKETGNLREAEIAYRRSLAIRPGDADAYLQLGHVLKVQGRNDDAVSAYTTALELDPESDAARGEIEHLGGRQALPESATRSTAMWQKLMGVTRAIAASEDAIRGWASGSAYPLAAYDRFRRDIPIRPPPGPLRSAANVIVVIDAYTAAPFLIRETLRSVQDQSVQDWQAVVLSPDAVRRHPVASFADTDVRIRFAETFDDAISPARVKSPDQRASRVVSLTAGTVLDAEAVAWLVFAGDRTEARAIFADHDHGVVDAEQGLVRADPWLPGIYDPDYFARVDAPALVIADIALFDREITERRDGDAIRRAVMKRCSLDGPVAHVARLLATNLDLPIAARGGRPDEDDGIAGRHGVASTRPRAINPSQPARALEGSEQRIAIIIPTRNQPVLLARAVETLRSRARAADRLDILVVDNRSDSPEQARLLERYAAEGAIRVFPMDAAFNWSLASNQGAAATDGAILVFANDDIEMLTQDWDDILLSTLARDEIGAVGVRLLYPDTRVQHGGMVFGLARGEPEHEGRGCERLDPGPGDRLITPRAIAAATGAFLAVRRDRFDAVGGFDANTLCVAHSDVDFCLKLREQGLRILYLPSIEAIHHESATRGQNETKADVAWDESERRDLHLRWGSSLAQDPGVSPYWAPGGEPFDGLREPSIRMVLQHLDCSATAAPWTPTRKVEQDARLWAPDPRL